MKMLVEGLRFSPLAYIRIQSKQLERQSGCVLESQSDSIHLLHQRILVSAPAV